LEQNQKKGFWRIDIDFGSSSSKLFEHLHRSFQANRLLLPTEFLCSMPSSATTLIAWPSTISVEEMQSSESILQIARLQVPLLERVSKADSITEQLVDLHTWIGGVAARLPTFIGEIDQLPTNGFVSSIDRPISLHYEQSAAVVWRCDGLFSENCLQAIVQRLKELLLKEKNFWASISMAGIQDSPVSFTGRVRAVGENDTCLVLRPDCSFLLYLSGRMHDFVQHPIHL